jgi:hypothetical protein
MAANNQRRNDTKFQISGNDAQSLEYNPASGGQKSLIVGPRLLPISVVTGGVPGWTTNIATATALPSLGLTLYIYNNAATAGSVTVGQSSAVTAQAIGAVDANGNVGVACPPNAYTELSMGSNQWIIGSAATLICYIVEDPTTIIQQTGSFVQQNPAGSQPIT